MKARTATWCVIVSLFAVAVYACWPSPAEGGPPSGSDTPTLTVTVCNGGDCGASSSGGPSRPPGAPITAGGGSPSIPTSAVITGFSSPDSTVTLLEDGAIASTTVASADGSFRIVLSDMSAGTYTFGIFAVDLSGRRTPVVSFTEPVESSAATLVGNLILPPTLDAAPLTVSEGGAVSFSGQTVPDGSLFILVQSGQAVPSSAWMFSARADGAGDWHYSMSAVGMKSGSYTVSARAASGLSLSQPSSPVIFGVGTAPISIPPPAAVAGDLNGDGRVNIIDFSILAYWYGRKLPDDILRSLGPSADAVVDLKDFSILAYRWTG